MRGSDFAELQAFSAVVRAGSFSAAAAELRMSRSALSQTIRKLEDRLGVLLLNRTTRSVGPTEAGAALMQGFDPAAAAITAAVHAAQEMGGRIAGRLSLHAQRLAYETILAPTLRGFLDIYPDIVLDIRIDDATTDIVADGFDAGLRLGELLEQDAVAVRLGHDLRQIAVASPDYLARHGTPRTPQELSGHRCLAFRWPGRDAIYDWEFAGEDGRWFSIAVTGPLVLSEQRALVEAAADGVGIAFWTESAVRPLVEAGRLVTLLERWAAPFPGFSLYYPRQRQRSPALRALVDHLRRADRHCAPKPAQALQQPGD